MITFVCCLIALIVGYFIYGKFIERIGSYNPNTNPATIVLDFEKALDWMNKGAQPTDTVKSLFSKDGIIAKYAEAKAKKSEA